MPYYFPAHLLNPDPVKVGIQARVVDGGTSLAGDQTVIQTDGGGRIEITYGEFDLDDPIARRVWEVWQDYLSGGARIVYVPVLSLELAPIPPGMDSAFVYDDIYFPTAYGFSPGYVIAETVGATPLRSTTISIDVSQGDELQPGTWFSIAFRAHKIRRILSVTGSTYELEISPPTRAEIADGTNVVFDWPVVQCRAVLGQDLIAPISLGQYGSMAVSFVEDFTPPDEVTE